MPKVSIIIPTKNEEQHLPKLLETIKSQTLKDFEVIVADAKSTDKTRDIALAYGAKVIEGGLPGPGRNAGAVSATGDVLVFLDADVLLPSTKYLQECLTEMDRKGFDVATCNVKPLSRKPIDRALHEVYNAYAMATEKIRPHAPGFCILVRRHAHESIKGFDEDVVFGEDHDYVQRASKEGKSFGILRAHPIRVSVRRLEKDGRLGTALKYMFGELRMLTKGSFKEMPFDYIMGGDENENNK
ncbi:MAG: glycosyltransferase [Patescibacteria group bacterium]